MLNNTFSYVSLPANNSCMGLYGKRRVYLKAKRMRLDSKQSPLKTLSITNTAVSASHVPSYWRLRKVRHIERCLPARISHSPPPSSATLGRYRVQSERKQAAILEQKEVFTVLLNVVEYNMFYIFCCIFYHYNLYVT